MKNFKQVGFTLIELMIVVAIVAILASVILPQFAGTSNCTAPNPEQCQ